MLQGVACAGRSKQDLHAMAMSLSGGVGASKRDVGGGGTEECFSKEEGGLVSLKTMNCMWCSACL